MALTGIVKNIISGKTPNMVNGTATNPVQHIISGNVPDFKGGTVASPGFSNVDVVSNAPVNPGSVSVPVASSSGPDWASGAGALLGGLGSVVGGLLSYHEQKKANKIAQQQFAENLAFQKDQFYNAMQHRVRDALKAGVHPLAALGVSAHGSASPTAHVQSATGLGQAVSSLSSSINSYFENAIKQSQLDMIQSQIATNKALAIKYSADAGRQIAETAYTNKELNNYNVYRIWDRVNNTINALSGSIRAGFTTVPKKYDELKIYNSYYK